MGTKPHALVLAGRGRYEDPWHDLAATSHALARLLDEHDINAEVRSIFHDRLDDLDTVDLLIVNGGQGRIDPDFDGDNETWIAYHEAINSYAQQGNPIFIHHQGINAFLDSEQWHHIVGGRWIRGTTYHPPISDAHFSIVKESHPLTAGIDDIDVFDERYTLLAPEPGVTVTLTQHEEGSDQPCAWVNTRDGLRSVYDSLGHDLRSFQSPSRAKLLMHEINWLLDRPLDE